MPQYTFERLQPEYAALWSRMQVTKPGPAAVQARKIIAHKDRYKAVQEKTGGKIPWAFIGCAHMRESGGDFNTWLHNGDPMRDKQGHPIRTIHVTKNRPPNPDCSWEDGAYDALVTCQHFDEIEEWGPARVAYALETFNGFGYRNPSRNIPSPYLWGGTNIQKCGKFVEDNVYDKTVMDPQIGGMAVLQMLMSLDPEATFVQPAPPIAPEEQPEEPPVTEGKAIDTEDNVKPLTKSKTMWGGIGGYLTSLFGLVTGFFDKLNNPYTLAAFIVVLIAISVFAYLIIKGRIDVQHLVKHLSDEE